MRTSVALLVLIGCGPGIDVAAGGDASGGMDPGTCDTPADDAMLGRAARATMFNPERLFFRADTDPLECDYDLSCSAYEELEAAPAFEVGRLESPKYFDTRCTCDEVAPNTWDEHCDWLDDREIAALEIHSVSDDCVVGVIERVDEPASPFVASFCE